MENQTIAPPLDLDLSTVDTSLPLVADGEIVDFTLFKVERKAVKDNKGYLLSIDHKNLSTTKAVKGEPLGAGAAHVFNNVMLNPVGKSTWEMVTRNIAELVQAVGVKMTLAEFINGGWQQLQGQTVWAKVAYIPEGPDKNGIHRRAKNEIALYLKQGQ